MNDMEVYYRNDDTGEEKTTRIMSRVPFHMLNGEIRQENGAYWIFKDGKIVEKKRVAPIGATE